MGLAITRADDEILSTLVIDVAARNEDAPIESRIKWLQRLDQSHIGSAENPHIGRATGTCTRNDIVHTVVVHVPRGHAHATSEIRCLRLDIVNRYAITTIENPHVRPPTWSRPRDDVRESITVDITGSDEDTSSEVLPVGEKSSFERARGAIENLHMRSPTWTGARDDIVDAVIVDIPHSNAHSRPHRNVPPEETLSLHRSTTHAGGGVLKEGASKQGGLKWCERWIHANDLSFTNTLAKQQGEYPANTSARAHNGGSKETIGPRIQPNRP